MRLRKRYILLLLLVALLGYGLYLMPELPVKDTIAIDYPESFFITSANSLDRQGHNECAGFATAYVLRHFGIEAAGASVYDAMGYRVPLSGYVSIKGITRYLQRNGLQPYSYRGNLDTLKTRVPRATQSWPI